MKKYIALLLVLTTLFTLAACGRRKNDAGSNKETENTTAAPMDLPDDALSLMEAVWATYGEGDKFYAIGGSYNEDETKNYVVENAPGKYDLENEGMTTSLMVPADKLTQIADAASLAHGMLTNNFTCGTYHLNDGVDAKAFGEAMQKSIIAQQFLCGAPEAVFVAVVGDQYVVAAYGMKDLLDTLQNKLTTVYPGTQVLCNEIIPG